MTSIVWFRRDLRTRDNPALLSALEAGNQVLPVYIHDIGQPDDWKPGAASNWYLQQSIYALKKDLAKHGLNLVTVQGQPASTLLHLSREVKANRVIWNRIYEPHWQQCDRLVEEELRKAGLETESHHDQSLLRPGTVYNQSGKPYRVFTAFWKKIEPDLIHSHPLVPEQTFSRPAVHSRTPLRLKPSLCSDEMIISDTFRWHQSLQQYWTPGESAALRRLTAILNHLDQYPEQRDFPGMNATSGLSTALHFGEISAWRVIEALRPAWAGEWGNTTARGAASLARQLGWRDFAIHQLHAYPRSPDEPIRAEFRAGDIWSEDPILLEAWQNGKTGFDLVDAGMRQLWETGWMHNRVRMIVASFLTKQLGQHWIHGARWFWDTLVDADLANNTMGWQWVAGCGCDAAPYYRIFNPERQAQRFDQEEKYVKHWLGNRSVPSAQVVNLQQAREAALARYRLFREHHTSALKEQ